MQFSPDKYLKLDTASEASRIANLTPRCPKLSGEVTVRVLHTRYSFEG